MVSCADPSVVGPRGGRWSLQELVGDGWVRFRGLFSRSCGDCEGEVGNGRREEPLELGLGPTEVPGLPRAQLHHPREPVFDGLSFPV